MTPELKKELEKMIREQLIGLISEAQLERVLGQKFGRFAAGDRFIFEKLLQIMDGRDIQLGLTTGTIIGTSASQKLGFYGRTPVSQRLKASYSNWGAYTDVVAALVDLGLFDQT